MSRQTSYDLDLSQVFAGVIADLRPLEVESKLWESETSGIFGIFVARGTGDNDVILPAASTADIIGATIATQTRALGLYEADMSIDEGEVCSVMRTGNMYVETEDACAPGGAVYVRYASGDDGTQLGAVRATAVTDETIALTDWIFEETGAAGEVVKIRKA